MKGMLIGLAVAAVTLAAGAALAQSVTKKTASSSAEGWTEKFDEAKASAAASKRLIFALFTGSDWCPWCVKLEKDILSSKEFKAFAAANLVLFKADFPQSKPQSAETKKQNEQLGNQYGVEGYPTILLLDANGKRLDQTGYQRGGGAAFVLGLTEMMKKQGLPVTLPAAK